MVCPRCTTCHHLYPRYANSVFDTDSAPDPWASHYGGTSRDLQSRRPARRGGKDSQIFAPRIYTRPHGREHTRACDARRWARPILVGLRPERRFCHIAVWNRSVGLGCWGSHPLGKRLSGGCVGHRPLVRQSSREDMPSQCLTVGERPPQQFPETFRISWHWAVYQSGSELTEFGGMRSCVCVL
ncbi:hypothetical protein BC826DRAFT_211855 [Russula brevipes]|nr:hypothetical protein BC826DRAFT_211855 [Russula brevipes]